MKPCRGYNTNAGTVGSVDAGLAVYVRSVTAGSVATGEGELVKAGSSVTIGHRLRPKREHGGRY